MCGIGGYGGGADSEILRRMRSRLAHRGPDGSGQWEDRQVGVGLCHTRLSILDLSPAGAQPMKSPDGRFVLTYNGEIYNFKELRQELASRGERFTSTGDTEVLLRGLALDGESFLGRLNGIFAFALWDDARRELLIARDSFGVKPLYYAEPAPGELVFASEIKALFADPRVAAAPNFEALIQHLSFCHAAGTETAFDGIRRLAPGSTLRWEATARKFSLTRYWKPRFSDSLKNRTDAVERLRAAIETSVRRQLVSDVPVGAFFSGGIDSTAVAALGARDLGDSLRCYTISYPSEENVLDRTEEDGPYARRAAKHLGLSHTEIEIKPEVANLLPRLLYHLDEPIADPAVIACYLVSRLAAENKTKVLLSGQGADELLAGYPRYKAMDVTSVADRVPRSVRTAAARMGRVLPGGKEGKLGASMRRVRRVLASLEKDPDRRFLSFCSSTPSAAVLGVLSKDVRAQIGDRLPEDECLRHMNDVGLEGPNRWLERDLSVYLPNHNLVYTDKMSMAAGVEARVPLLDVELVNLVTAMPVEWKIHNGNTKAILREAVRGLIPDEIIDRPKAGFGAPYRKWLRYDLSEMWNDLTSPSVVRLRGWFDPVELKRIRNVSQSGQEDLYMLQWAVLTIELWARQFMDSRNSA